MSDNGHPIWKALPFENEQRHYKPAALLVVLNMMDDREALDGRVRYVAYDKRFKELMVEADWA